MILQINEKLYFNYIPGRKMNIIVNGATRGIGKEVALLFARKKSNSVLITGRNENTLRYLASIKSAGRIIPFTLDMSRFDYFSESFRDAVISSFDHVDILINTAGSLILKDFADFTSEEARLIMETNFVGPASVIKILEPLLTEGSHIVNISSMGGFQGSLKFRGLSYYSASKAALSCLSECLAEEFRNEGIVVNCLALGSVQTEMLKEAFPGYKAPVNAMEMAELIVDFAVKGKKYYNGKVIPVSFSSP